MFAFYILFHTDDDFDGQVDEDCAKPPPSKYSWSIPPSRLRLYLFVIVVLSYLFVSVVVMDVLLRTRYHIVFVNYFSKFL